MMADAQKLLIISRDALLDAVSTGQKPSATDFSRIFRVLAQLSRAGFRLLLTAPEPERWVPTRGNVDDALNNQSLLMESALEAGADLEGIYYVPRSLLTQDRNRAGALRDILKRYAIDSSRTTLISSSTPFLKAASGLGISTIEIVPPGKKGTRLLSALKSLV
jgi:hypothetical protein